VSAKHTNFRLLLVAEDLDNTNGMTQVRNFSWPLVIFFSFRLALDSIDRIVNLRVPLKRHMINELCTSHGTEESSTVANMDNDNIVQNDPRDDPCKCML
jgi:hypothetical protein